jgi:hypothetical protein
MPTITVTAILSAQQAARVAPAVGRSLGLTNPDTTPRDATQQEVVDYFTAYHKNRIRQTVMSAEENAVVVPPVDIT